MKTLIFIHGPNGVGKSTVCRRLLQRLPHSSWLESEWCRMINPFELTPEIESLTERHMTALLRGYLECSLVESVILSYGVHGPRKRIFDRVLDNLRDLPFQLLPITVTCSEEENIKRMVRDNRDTERIQRALQTRTLYEGLGFPVINTTFLSVEDTVEKILAILQKNKQVV